MIALAWLFVKGWASTIWAVISVPPGSYIAAGLAALFGIWLWGHHQFGKGKEACETAHRLANERAIVKEHIVYRDVIRRVEVRTAADQKINTDNQKVITYVRIKAHDAPNAGAVCVPVDVADSVRDIR